MSSPEDMYQLGVRDAELNELNELYYQHYYYYRKGYDTARRRMKRGVAVARFSERPWISVSLVVSGLLIIVGGMFLMRGVSLGIHETEATPMSGTPIVRQTIVVTDTVVITPTEVITEPTPLPFLHTGGRAEVVNVGDAPLLGRREPGLYSPIDVAFPQGTVVTLLEGPVEADGYTWWRVEHEELGVGWSAERGPTDVPWLEPR